MPSRRVHSPKEVVKVRRSSEPELSPIGSKIAIEAEVTRHGRNGFNTLNTITIRIPGYEIPVTVPLNYLLGKE